ncbi:MAG: sigma-54-dependent Fis family transcriptional regulator [Bacteroidetes bacterium]|nr:MAG: sigma-54-dependent Fis family transcriptional regulator [Bacteroidota bacterium]
MNDSDLTILIVDDEASQRDILSGYLRKRRYTVATAATPAEALNRIAVSPVDLVLSDFRMPGMTGFELLRHVKQNNPATDVILMTAFGTVEGAVAAMKEGAYDYIGKPIDLEELELLLQRLKERRRLISENRMLREQLTERFSAGGVIAESPEMQNVVSTALRVAASRAPVLVRGESGTGKEVIARIIHQQSERGGGPFIAVNCAALNDNLLESELFGHEKGAFTGAERQRRGRFEAADGGTLFLDEIGDISPAMQVRLLRVLQERSFERVGGTETVTVDVRIIAATHRNLEKAIAEGAFREDLYYRLNVVAVEIPPLRSRRADIAPLLEHFLMRFAAEQGRPDLTISREAWDLLLRYDYPGNVRELENIVQRSVIFCRGDAVTQHDLPPTVRGTPSERSAPSSPAGLDEAVERLEKELIFEALRVHGNNQSKAAAQLGVNERTLRYKLKKWGLKEKERPA